MKFSVVSEREFLPKAIAYSKQYPDSEILCLDFWAERTLLHQGIAFKSGRELCIGDDAAEWTALGEEIARTWHAGKIMAFFEYHDISIGEALEPMLEMYFSTLFFYVRAFLKLKQKYPNAELYVPIRSPEFSTTGPLAPFEGRAVYDAAIMSGFTPTSDEIASFPQNHLFPRSLFQTFFIKIYNAVISLLPKQDITLYASEYWSHIGPILDYMPNTELVLMESGELRSIGWRSIIAHRIRIQHPLDVSLKSRKRALMIGKTFKENSKSVRPEISRFLKAQRADLVWEPVLEALAYLIEYSPRVIADIDGLSRIYQKEKPALVVQRASIGGRLHHFFLMAKLARRYNIPSVELQHAGAIFNPHSVHSKLETQYLAAFGDVEREQYVKNGYDGARIFSVGSPRLTVPEVLDKTSALSTLGLAQGMRTVLVAVPSELPGLQAVCFSSYEIESFLRDIRYAKDKNPHVQYILKFRTDAGDPERLDFINELFPEGGVIAADLPMQSVIMAADIVTSGNSTILYEALIRECPLILFPWKSWDYSLRVYKPMAPYATNGDELGETINRLFNEDSYAEEVAGKEKTFIARHAFGRDSAERTARLFLKLIKVSESF